MQKYSKYYKYGRKSVLARDNCVAFTPFNKLRKHVLSRNDQLVLLTQKPASFCSKTNENSPSPYNRAPICSQRTGNFKGRTHLQIWIKSLQDIDRLVFVSFCSKFVPVWQIVYSTFPRFFGTDYFCQLCLQMPKECIA